MNTWAALTAGVYTLGFVTTWYIAARHYTEEFGSGWEAGVWGLLAAVVWPIFAAGYGMSRIV